MNILICIILGDQRNNQTVLLEDYWKKVVFHDSESPRLWGWGRVIQGEADLGGGVLELKKQGEEYKKGTAAVGGDNLEAGKEELELRRSNTEEARCNQHIVEGYRLELQVTDLGEQVIPLLLEADVEAPVRDRV